ncbi:MAG: DeoR/GlpR family DNA-binding transcription regulator [Spirochaetota bacterium]
MDSIARLERKRKVLELLQTRGTLSLEALAEMLQISPITLRKDFRDLEKQRLINRLWGGVSLASPLSQGSIFEDKMLDSMPEKMAIAQTALALVKPKDVMGLGPGTTTYEFSKFLSEVPEILVVTNSVKTAYLLVRLGVRIMMPGGFSRESSYSLTSPKTAEIFEGVHLDKLFLGADGVDVEGGITTLHQSEVDLLKTMIAVAGKVIVLADYTKLGLRRFASVCSLDDVDLLITDDKCSKAAVEHLRERGVRVEVASVQLGEKIHSMSNYKFR